MKLSIAENDNISIAVHAEFAKSRDEGGHHKDNDKDYVGYERTVQHRTVQDRIGKDKTGLDRAGQDRIKCHRIKWHIMQQVTSVCVIYVLTSDISQQHPLFHQGI